MNSFVYIDGDHNQDDHGNFDQIFFDEAGTSNIDGGITVDNCFDGQAEFFAINGGQYSSNSHSYHANFFSTTTPNLAQVIQNSHALLRTERNSTVLDLGITKERNKNPIGLKLTKSPSFANKLNQYITSYGKKKQQQQELGAPQASDDVVSPNNLKASNFPALSLHIGSWEKISRHEGDLVVKCYFKKRTLVWEALEGNKKIKIEFHWSNISAMRAYFRPNKLGTLEIMLHNKPSFSLERDPQPRKHTTWDACPDFTTNKQASLVRIHRLKFAPGVLEKHYEGVVRADPHLLALNNKPFPSHANPFFDHDNTPNCLDNTLLVPHHQFPPSFIVTQSQRAVPIRAIPMHGTASAMPVMFFPGDNQKSTEPSHLVARGSNRIHHDPSTHNQNAALQPSPNTLLHGNQSEAATSSQAAGPSAANNNQPFCHEGSDARGSDPMLQAVQCPMRSYSLHQDHTAPVHQMVPSTMIVPSPSDLPHSNQSSFQDDLDHWSPDSCNYRWIQDYHSGKGDQPP